ncbi:MAG: hypothetical protein AAB774_00500 [Patescibacteria group bacterium]
MTQRKGVTLGVLFVSAMLVIQPLLTVSLQISPLSIPTAQAEVDKPEDIDPLDEDVPADEQELIGNDNDTVVTGELNFDSTDGLETLYNTTSNLVISPEDQTSLLDGEVDIRTTDYLLQLVLPEEQGGYGFDHIKVNRILKNYTSEGAGKFDREGTQSITDEGDIVSGHNRGQAVDVSEVGEVTCKLVEKRHIGGSTTRWQKPLPIKVAWQSVEGVKNNPTPTAQSILGASGEMTAQSIVAYLNQSGEMDYYIEFVKGMDLKTIISYVGANIYLKTFGVNQVLADPFADGLLHALGGAVLEKSLPGLPAGLSTGDNNEDARVAFAKSRVEQGLNLPAGSLKGYGWDNILEATGKRHLETSLGIPSGYFDKHTLDEAMNSETITAVLDHFGRSDDGLNLMIGTVDALKNKDAKGLKMAGVNILEDALKLTDDQKKILEKAVAAKKTPDEIKLDGVPAGNTIGTEDLKKLFSTDPKKQKELKDSLKIIGLAMVRQAAEKAVKNKYSGLTNIILDDLLNPQKEVLLGDLTNTVGASSMGVQIGVDDAGLSKGKVDIKSFVTRHGDEIAKFLNNEYSIKDPTSQIIPADLTGLFDGKNFALAEKLGAVQVDKAFGWNAGSSLAVIKGDKKLGDAMQEVFANYVGKTLGLQNQNISLKGNVQENYGYAVLSERLGITQEKLRANDSARTLFYGANGIDPSEGYRVFNLNSSQTLTELMGDGAFWDEETNVTGWRSIDIALGTPIGTVRSYLRDEITTKQLAKRATQGSLESFTADKIYDYFGISDQFRLEKTEIDALIKVFKSGDDQTLEEIEVGIGVINRLMGRSIDGKINYSKDTFLQYIVAPSSAAGTKLFLDQGLRLIAQSLGVNLNGYKYEDFETLANQIKSIYSGKGPTIEQERLERLRQEQSRLELISPEKRTAEQKARLVELGYDGTLQSYVRSTAGISDFFLRATGIPIEFRTDAEAFITGNWRLGIAAASFAALLPQINQFMPADNQFTYAEMRSALTVGDDAIFARANQMAAELGVENPVITEEMTTEARRQLIDEGRKNIEYRMSDSLLRKIDPAIPVGFSAIMFGGTEAERGQLLQNFAFGKLDTELAKLSPLYVKGMLKALYEGEIDAATTDDIVLKLIGQSGVSFGSFSNEFVSSFYQFARAQGQGDFFTNDTKYGAMWGFFDKWVSDNLNIGALPSGLSKSLYYAAKNGWNFNAELKDGQGITIVQSLNNLGKDILINRLSSWGDKQFGLPAGRVYEAYKLYTAISGAEKGLTKAIADYGSKSTQATAASSKVSAAKAALIMFAIELALSACSACQAFFGSVDEAIAAPPGFTQALVTGLIANALGLGPTGIYIAVAIYLFGVYKVEYLCPMPPQELYGVSEYDSPADQFDFGVPYDQLPADITQIRSSPSPGQNPFDWDDTQPFTSGDNQKIWMGWSRYYVGKLLDATMDYGEQRESPYKPLQVLTYRQANAEYFYPRTAGAFGDIAVGSDQYGLGYSQTTTKTTDWLHIGFGGLW